MKGSLGSSGDAASCLALCIRSARAAIRTGESSSDLNSWLLERLSSYFGGWVPRRLVSVVRAQGLRRVHSPQTCRVVLHDPCCGRLSTRTRRFSAECRSGDRPSCRFSRDILVPTAGVCESCSPVLPPGRPHALGTRNTPSISLSQLLCKLFVFCHLAHEAGGLVGSSDAVGPLNVESRKPLGHLPSPEDGPQTLTRPVTGLRNAPLGADPAGRASINFEVSNHRWTVLCSAPRRRRKARTLRSRAIGVPKCHGWQIIRKSSSGDICLFKTGETGAIASDFRKERSVSGVVRSGHEEWPAAATV